MNFSMGDEYSAWNYGIVSTLNTLQDLYDIYRLDDHVIKHLLI